MNTMTEYEILNISEETLHFYKSCFDKNGSPRKLERVRWQFVDNPVDEQIVDIARNPETDETAGIYAIAKVRFKVNNEVLMAAQSLDTIVDSNYRRRGLFIKLAESVYRKAGASGVNIIYGFPNGNSIHGFKKKLGWEILDPVPFLIKPLKTKYFTKKFKFLSWMPGLKLSLGKSKINSDFVIKEKQEFPKEVNEIWKSFAANIPIAIDRNQEYLNWRYLKKPFEDYKIAHCYKDGKYLGFVIYVVKEKHGGRVAYIMELIYDLSYPDAGKNLLNHAVNKIKEQDADLILAWSFEHSPNYAAYRKAFFVNMPEKIRPIELHFGARSMNEKLAELVKNRKNWFVSYSDSDTV